MSLTFLPLYSNAATVKDPAPFVSTKPSNIAESAENKALLNKLDEMKSIDKSKLNSSEKKKLQIEIRTTRHHLREGGGVYLSAGSVVLLLVLLIIIL